MNYLTQKTWDIKHVFKIKYFYHSKHLRKIQCVQIECRCHCHFYFKYSLSKLLPLFNSIGKGLRLISKTRLLGRFAPIFYFNCEHWKTKKKNFADFINKNRVLSRFKKKLQKIKNFKTQIFEILIIHKPSLGSREIPHKIWAQSVQPFWRLLDTNKQTDRQTS